MKKGNNFALTVFHGMKKPKLDTSVRFALAS